MSASVRIDRLPADVYAFVSDPTNDVRWRTALTTSGLTTPPPLRVGSEGFAGVEETVVHWRVTKLEPNVLVDWDLLDGPFAGTGGYRLAEDGSGTLFTLVADVTPKGFYRLLGPLFGWIGRRQNLKDVQRLRSLLEEPPS